MSTVSYISCEIQTTNKQHIYIKNYYDNGSVVKITLTDNANENMHFSGRKKSKMSTLRPNFTPLIRIREILKCNKEMLYLNVRKIEYSEYFFDDDAEDEIKKRLPSKYSNYKPITPGTRIVVEDEINNKHIVFFYKEDSSNFTEDFIRLQQQKELRRKEKQLNKAFDYCLRFGKYKGNTIPFVQNMEPSYLDWVLKQGWVNEKIKSYINTVRQYLQNMHS